MKRKWVRAVMRVLTVAALASGLTGCWDQGSFNQRAAVLILTVAPAQQSGQWLWSFYFPNPSTTVSSASRQSSQEEFYRLTVYAATLPEAYGKVQQQLARDVYLGQMEDIVISYKIPASVMATAVNAYNIEGLTPKTAYLVVAKSPAQAVAVTPQETTPSVYLTQYFDCQSCQPEMLSRPVWNVWTALVTPGVSPVIPYASSSTQISAIAVYPQSGRPVIFSRQETLGWAYLMGRVTKALVAVSLPFGRVVLGHVKGRVSTNVTSAPHAISADVHVSATGTIVEWPLPEAPTRADLALVQKATEQKLLAYCLSAIKAANASGTDPFGYGRALYFQHPAWPAQDPTYGYPIQAHITVRMTVQRSGVGT